MFVKYRGHQGLGAHPQEKVVRAAAARVNLILQTFEDGTGMGQGYAVELAVPHPAEGHRHHVCGRIDILEVGSVGEILDWLERYGRGEVWA